MPTILAADVGGTNMRFSLFVDGREVHHGVYPTANFKTGGVPAAAKAFLGDRSLPDAFCMACAGVVRNGVYHSHNMPFAVDAEATRRATGIPLVRLANDLEAAAHGLERLRSEDCAMLRTGVAEPEAPVLLVAVGTGLGGALLVRAGGHVTVLPSEPGQTGFSPHTPEMGEILLAFHAEKGRPPIVEEIVSGPGLERIYRFVVADARSRDLVGTAPLDGAAAIAAAGLSGRDPLAERAIELLAGGIGWELRNFAVRVGATGGIYLAGGVAEKIEPALRRPAFLEAFTLAFGERLLGRVPITLVKSARLGIDGAMALAERALAERA